MRTTGSGPRSSAGVLRAIPMLGFAARPALCLGHVGRRFGHVREELWNLVRSLCDDPEVDKRPCDALSDLKMFVGPEPT